MFLPGDKKYSSKLEQIIRVDHAGEYGAQQIYQGQLSVFKNTQHQQIIEHMLDQEKEHLLFFEQKITELKIRPTLLQPFWYIAGYLLGVVTAKLGIKHAMICTESIEEIIDKHYQEQLNIIDNNETVLKQKIDSFRAEEVEHKEIAEKYLDNLSISDNILSYFISKLCLLSISLAKKI
jgi:ubiquinone biosynthesis monooxygenase Coq7